MNNKTKITFVLLLLVGLKVFSINDSIIKTLKQELKLNNLSSKKKADYYILLGKEYSKLNKADSSFFYYSDALKFYKNLGLYEELANCNYSIFKLLNSQVRLDANPIIYLDSYFNYAKQNNDTIKLIRAYASYASLNYTLEKYPKAITFYNKSLSLSNRIKNTLMSAKLNSNLGLLYSGFVSQDSARLFFDKSLKLYPKKNVNAFFSTYLNYANSYQKEGKWIEAISFLKKAELLKPTIHEDNLNKKLYEKLYNCYSEIKDYKNAFFYSQKHNDVKDKINITSQNIAISKFDNANLRAENAEKEKENIKNKAQSKQFKMLSIATLFLLVFVGVTAFLLQKNTKRKQLLAEQEKALEKQKVSTLLKDQEINSINAMIEGQEKERQRIANDLHDDLGGLMATIKLQFNTLQEQQTPDLFDKTNNLLDQAYNKIRSIAHAKNSGVIAKQGLLKAVKNMAHNVSSASVIDIEVTDFGLESRLENSLELSIFRIIQELTTNIIKHAEATHATISLTNHENSLNIMIEDNGKGFNANKVVRNNGMGLHSIEKRVEHLEGELKIESQINQGTTIIIDIPL